MGSMALSAMLKRMSGVIKEFMDYRDGGGGPFYSSIYDQANERRVMKKFSVALAAALMLAVVGCGSNEATEQNEELKTEKMDESVLPSQESELSTPVVKDGVTKPSDDCVEVCFEWEPVDGAEGYEILEQNKYYEEDSYGDPVTSETTECVYVTGAQDYFDFIIQVRAFRGTGDNRVFSDWSSFASGKAYDEADIDAELADSPSVTFASYDELIAAISKGLKEGFSEDEQFAMDISTCFFMNNSDFEILGYIKRDLDGDGTPELIFGENAADGSGPQDGWDSIIYDLFTMKDGKLIHVFDGWERNRFYMCEDGTIANEGSSGAAYSSWAYYNYKDGKIEIIESVFTDLKNETEGVWYYSDKEPYEDKSKEITEDEGWDIVNKYAYQKLEFTPFN